jgi:release factor glutamine methyltransferase
LLAKLPAATGIAVDISRNALAVAEANAQALGVADRLTLKAGNLFAPVTGQAFDVIVSNPPYIPAATVATLAPEVQREPQQALSGGEDGLDFYRQILSQAARFLRPAGLLVFEVGIGQAHQVIGIAKEINSGLEAIAVEQDYAGIERVVVFTLPNREADK